MFAQQVVVTFAFAFSLVCSQYDGDLNYVMINILKLSQNISDDNDSTNANRVSGGCSDGAFVIVEPDIPSDNNGSADAVPPTELENTTYEPPPFLPSTTYGPPPLGQIGTGHSNQAPSTFAPSTTASESPTTMPTEGPTAPPVLCPELCAREINITWLSLPPFIFEPKNNSKKMDGKITGVFYSIIGRAAYFCCKYLEGRGTRLQYTHKAENRDSLHANIFHGAASIGMPVFIDNEFGLSYGGRLAFVKVLESPGLVVIANKDNAKESDVKVLWRAIYNEWPVVFISLLLCAISGICVWVLDTTWNVDEFPRRFHRGAFEGFWWAFVTMSTVGYGDKAPKSVIGRLFCIAWIMIGLTVCSLMTATLTTALTTAANRDVELVGKKIAVLKGSPAFEDVVRHGGRPTTFDNFDDMRTALLQYKTVSGIMEEMYSGLYWMGQVRDSRLHVAKVIDRKRSYGFTFKHDDIFAWPVEDCIRNLILHRRDDVYAVMKDLMDQMEDQLAVAMADEEVFVLAENSAAFRAIVISLTIFLGALIGVILLCELLVYLCQRFAGQRRNSVGKEDDYDISGTTTSDNIAPKREALEV